MANLTHDSIPSRHRAESVDSATAAFLAFRNGDQSAFALLVNRYSKMMRQVARRYVRTKQDEEDAVQDAWLSFARSADRILEPAAVGGWLRSTVTHAAIAVARRSSRERPSCDVVERGCSTQEPGFDRVGLDLEQGAVRSAVARLTPGEQQLIWLVVDPDVSYAEISRRIGRTPGAIGPTRARTLSKLRRDRAIRELSARRAS